MKGVGVPPGVKESTYKLMIQTILFFADLFYASTIVTVTLLTVCINSCWK